MTSFELQSPDGDFLVEAKKGDGLVHVKLGKESFAVALTKEGPREYVAVLGERRIRFSLEEITNQSVRIRLGDYLMEFRRAQQSTDLRREDRAIQTRRLDSLNSPMPGRVISIAVMVGQKVSEGDPVVVIESMKMESVLRSDREATIDKVLVAEGDSVKRGQELVRFSVAV